MRRGGSRRNTGFRMPYEELESKLMSAKAFIVAFFQVEEYARRTWGQERRKAVPYDPKLKGLMEVLVNGRNEMCGFRVHWPNGFDSIYRRSEDGIEMNNCFFDEENDGLCLLVGHYASRPGKFSPLVEEGMEPIYSNLDNCDVTPAWPK